MTTSIRQRIVISFAIFIMASTLIWFLNYYKYQLLTEKLQIIEKKDHAFNMILEARRYEKNFFLFHNTEDLALTAAGCVVLFFWAGPVFRLLATIIVGH